MGGPDYLIYRGMTVLRACSGADGIHAFQVHFTKHISILSIPILFSSGGGLTNQR